MPNPDITIHTDADASLTDWWITNGIFPSRGLQHKAELDHIVLELTAVKPGIYTYCNDKNSLLARVIFDNVTAIAYINNMGGMKNETGNNIGQFHEVFPWKINWVSVVHIPGRCTPSI